MDYKTNELTGLITPIEITSEREYFRVMGKNSREIYCVYEIDPDCTCHPAGTEWDVNGVHKHLPFKKGAGVNGLTITGEERATKELEDKAPERKAIKEYKRADKKAEEKDKEEFYKTPVGERKTIFIPNDITALTASEVKQLEQIDAQTASENINEILKTTKEVSQKKSKK